MKRFATSITYTTEDSKYGNDLDIIEANSEIEAEGYCHKIIHDNNHNFGDISDYFVLVSEIEEPEYPYAETVNLVDEVDKQIEEIKKRTYSYDV